VGIVFIISSLVILYSDDYMFGDLNIVRFISLFFIFVVSIIKGFSVMMIIVNRILCVGIN